MTNDHEPHVWLLLRSIGARERRDGANHYFVLDEFDTEFFLKFDVSEDPEILEAKGKADILVFETGEHPRSGGIRVVMNAGERRILQFMFGLGVERFSESTRKALYENNRPIRANAE